MSLSSRSRVFKSVVVVKVARWGYLFAFNFNGGWVVLGRKHMRAFLVPIGEFVVCCKWETFSQSGRDFHLFLFMEVLGFYRAYVVAIKQHQHMCSTVLDLCPKVTTT